MKRFFTTLLALCLLLALCAAAQAQEASDGAAPENTVTLDEVHVVANPIIHGNEVDNYGGTTTVVGEEQIRELNAMDLSSALRRSPGVTITRYNPVGAFGGGEGGAVFIRGMGSSRPGSEIKTFIDGVPVYMGLWNHPLLDLLPLDPAARIEVVKGPQPHRFGDVFSAINIIPKTGRGQETQTAVQAAGGSYGTFSQSVEHQADKGDYAYALGEGFRRSDGHRTHSDGATGSLYGSLEAYLNDNWDMRLFALAASSTANDPGEEDSDTNAGTYDTGLRLTTVTLANTYDKTYGEVKLFANAGEGYWYDQAGSADDTLNDFWFWGLKAKQTLVPTDGLELTAGIDQHWWDGNIRYTFDGATPDDSATVPQFSLTMPYIGANWLIGDRYGWHVIPSAGVRLYSHNRFDDAAAPHAGIVAGYGDTEIHASASKGVVYPGQEVVLRSKDDAWKDLSPEEVWHGEIGIRHTFADMVRADLTFFNDDGRDRYVVIKQGVWDNVESYRIQGIEATVTVTPTDTLSMFASLTTQESHPGDMPYVPNTSASAGVNWDFAKNWRIAVDAEYISDMYALRQFRGKDASNTEEVDEHTLLNAKLTRSFDIPAWDARGEVFLAMENITDEDYEYRPDYRMPGINGMIGARITF